jgi:hypothetical protein
MPDEAKIEKEKQGVKAKWTGTHQKESYAEA